MFEVLFHLLEGNLYNTNKGVSDNNLLFNRNLGIKNLEIQKINSF